MRKYSIKRLNELIEFCKVKPRDIKPTEKSVYRYANNKRTLLQFMPPKKYNVFLRHAANIALENLFDHDEILNFFEYTYLFNRTDTTPYFILIEVLEKLKTRMHEGRVKTLIFLITKYYSEYLETINMFHEDLDAIYKIMASNREYIDDALEVIAKELDTDIDTIYFNLMEPPTRIHSPDVNSQTDNIIKFLTEETDELSKDFKKVSVVHGVLTSEFYYIARDLMYNSNSVSSDFLERMISGMEELVDYYKENFDKFSVFSYTRFGTLVSGKNSLKLRYNLDNELCSMEDILKDYTEDLIFLYNTRLYSVAVGSSVKLLEEMYKIQLLYRKYNIDSTLCNQFREVFRIHLGLFKNGLRSTNDTDIRTFIIENSVPGISAGVFFKGDENFRMFDSSTLDYFNLFNDRVKGRDLTYRKFDLGYVYDLRGKNETN